MTREKPIVTVTESVSIARPPEAVWDYTQDYAHRTEWDRSIVRAEPLPGEPRSVRVELRGLGSCTLQYRLFRRPERTSLQMIDITSRWLAGGGGSWEYAPDGAGTRWTQTNSLVFPYGWQRLATPFYRRLLRSGTRAAMREAKRILEEMAAPPT